MDNRIYFFKDMLLCHMTDMTLHKNESLQSYQQGVISFVVMGDSNNVSLFDTYYWSREGALYMDVDVIYSSN